MKTAHCLCVTVLAFSVGACVKPVPIEDGMPCPCADGYTCCVITNQCLSAGQVCQADAGGTSDVATERYTCGPCRPADAGPTIDVAIDQTAPVWTDAGQSKWQPIASFSAGVYFESSPSKPFLMGDWVTFMDGFDTGLALAYRFKQNDWLAPRDHFWPGYASELWAGLVWTGSRVVYWGGVLAHADPPVECNKLGGIYSPATDTWSAINTTGAPSLAVDGSGYTGTEVVLLGSSCLFRQDGSLVRGPVIGALYNPATDTWRKMSSLNAPTTTNGTDVVLGGKVVSWGGTPYVEGQPFSLNLNQSPDLTNLTNSGAVYNVADDTWTPMSTTNAPSPRSAMVSLAMRGKLFILGGTDGTTNSLGEQSYLRDGAIFDPETNTWTSISKDGSPTLAAGDGLWAEEQGLVYVWAFVQSSPMAAFLDVALWTYDPAADRWTSVDASGYPGMVSTYFVWTGVDLLAIGELSPSSPFIIGGYRYTP